MENKMKKLLIIAALVFAQNAQAADEVPSLLTAEAKTSTKVAKPAKTEKAKPAKQAKAAKPLTLQEQIAADAARDPYAEAPASPIKYQIKETVVTEGYEPPVAAEQMQPAKFTKMKNGNTVIRKW